MSNHNGIADRWADFKPSKALWFWSVAGAAFLTMILGFTAGGWTTGGSARLMAENAAREARAELASTVCVEKFMASASASDLAELKGMSRYQQDDFIEDGGWATLAGLEKAVPGSADLCADELVALESLPVRDVTVAPTATEG